MSKLNAKYAYGVHLDYRHTRVHRKSEADKVIAEQLEYIKELKRALWLARAIRAQEMRAFFNNVRGYYWEYNVAVWKKIESKCRAKAEEYR